MRIDQLPEILGGFKGKTVIVLGDLMLDEFIWGAVKRISPEAPVPVVEVKGETWQAGGAGNVVTNLAALGARPIPIGVVGKDRAAEQLRERFAESGAPLEFLVEDSSRPTTVKTRIVAHHQQMIRADREARGPLSPEVEKVVVKRFFEAISEADAVVVSDYGKGVLTPGVLAGVLPAAAEKVVCLDPKLRNFEYYQPVTVLTPNQSEAENASGIEITDEESLRQAARKIYSSINCRNLLITRGEHGMGLYFQQDGQEELVLIPTMAQEVFDVTGAGDTVIATLSLSLASGADPETAARIANYAAGVVVGKLGTATCNLTELRSVMGLVGGA